MENPELELVWDTVTGYSTTLSPRVVQWKEDWMANFTNDGFATMPCPGWMFSNVKSSAPEVEGWDIANAFPGGGGNWGGSFLAVPAMSEHPEEAKEFAGWLTDQDQELAAFEAAGNYPANLGAQQSLADENVTALIRRRSTAGTRKPLPSTGGSPAAGGYTSVTTAIEA